jgi:outer membrane lipoprotein-sorting protein
MNTIMKFVNKFGVLIVFVLIVLSTCTNSMNRKMSEKKMLKQVEGVQKSLDSLNKTLQKEIKVEGLKVEKRMIQSTDRKIMDLNRQIEIDKELKALDK